MCGFDPNTYLNTISYRNRNPNPNLNPNPTLNANPNLNPNPNTKPNPNHYHYPDPNPNPNADFNPTYNPNLKTNPKFKGIVNLALGRVNKSPKCQYVAGNRRLHNAQVYLNQNLSGK